MAIADRCCFQECYNSITAVEQYKTHFLQESSMDIAHHKLFPQISRFMEDFVVYDLQGQQIYSVGGLIYYITRVYVL